MLPILSIALLIRGMPYRDAGLMEKDFLAHQTERHAEVAEGIGSNCSGKLVDERYLHICT
jgi:hypothetical protein